MCLLVYGLLGEFDRAVMAPESDLDTDVDVACLAATPATIDQRVAGVARNPRSGLSQSADTLSVARTAFMSC